MPLLNIGNQTTRQRRSLKDLVYDPESGDFILMERGTANEGDIVDVFASTGFALSAKSVLENSNSIDWRKN